MYYGIPYLLPYTIDMRECVESIKNQYAKAAVRPTHATDDIQKLYKKKNTKNCH